MQAMGLTTEVNGHFKAEGVNTITSWSQRHSLSAFQIEISSARRIHEGEPTEVGQLVEGLIYLVGTVGAWRGAFPVASWDSNTSLVYQHPAVFLGENVLAGVRLPMLGKLSSAAARDQSVVVWLRRIPKADSDELDTAPLPEGADSAAVVTKRTLRLLGDEEGVLAAGHSIQVAPSAMVQARTAFIDDLPTGLTLQVAPELRQSIGTRVGRDYWAMGVGKDVAIPLRLEASNRVGDASISRCPLQLRRILGISPGDVVQLSRPPELGQIENRGRAISRVFERPPKIPTGLAVILGWIVLGLRMIDVGMEQVLKIFFRATRLDFGTSYGYPMDDDSYRIRLPEDSFPLLGIAPGEQVLVAWCGHTSVAIALLLDPSEMIEVSDEVVAHGTEWNVHKVRTDVVLVSAPIRLKLGMPARSGIEVRRRVRPQVLSRLNQTVIPILGVAVSAYVIEPLRGLPLLALGTVVFFLSLSNIRVPKTPKGLWP
jgi:hypothetical protein